MANNKLRIHRRTILRSAGLGGLAFALPPLAAMLDSKHPLGAAVSQAQSGGIPKRLLMFHWGNGSPMLNWTPQGGETGWSSPCLDELGSWKSQVCVLSGLSNNHLIANANVNYHEVFMLGAMNSLAPLPNGAGETRVAAGRTVDHVAAQFVGTASGLDPLVVCAKTRRDNEGFISYSDVGTRAEQFTDLQDLYDRYFFPLIDEDARAQAEALRTRRTNTMDYVRNSLSRLNERLGVEDRHRLEQHLGSVESVQASLGFSATCDQIDAPNHAREPRANATEPLTAGRCLATARMAIMALKCGLSRIATVQLCPSGADSVFDGAGVTCGTDDQGNPRPCGDHSTSHYGEDNPVYTTMTQWKMRQFVSLLDELAATPEADGSSLLDHTIVIGFSEMSESSGHRGQHMPVIVAGAGLQGGRHVRFPCGSIPRWIRSEEAQYCTASSDTPFANLWLTALRAMGVTESQVPNFGNSTGTLPGLWPV